VLLAAQPAFAQPDLAAGLRLGPNISRLSGTDLNANRLAYDPAVRGYLSAFLRLGFRDWFSLQTELALSSQGSWRQVAVRAERFPASYANEIHVVVNNGGPNETILKPDFAPVDATLRGTFELAYVQVPITARFMLPSKWQPYLAVGVAPGFRAWDFYRHEALEVNGTTGETRTVRGGASMEDNLGKAPANATVWGVGELGASLPIGLELSLRYEHSLNPVLEVGGSYRLQSLSLLIGLRL
jgi:hypothetical protein